MNPAVKRRLTLAFVIGGAGLIAARLVSPADEALGVAAQAAEPRVRGGARTPQAVAAGPAELQLARLEALRGIPLPGDTGTADTEEPPSARMFGPQSWQPPAPPPAPPPPAPPPQAPPFPYAYFGGMTDDGVRTAYFTKGKGVIALRAGDVVDSTYRIDSLDTQQMAITYLPLDQRQQIQFGGGQ